MYVSPGGSTNNGSPSPMQTILARIKGTSNPRSRQSYWEAQGLLLVTIIVEGTPFEPAPGSRQVKEASSKSTLSLLESQHINNHASNNNATTHSLQYIASSSTSTLVSSHASASSSQLSLGSTNTTNNNSSNDSQNDDGVKVFGPLPMDRFQAIVDLLFDPNIVYLNHRRAIINCARYVSASVADYFKEALSIKEPLDPLFHSAFLRQYTVRTGPNLAVFLHNSGVDVEGGDESQSSDQPKSSPQAVGLTTITPPNGLQKYFQIMLWHRCISDLIALYNRIQRLHVNNAIPSIKKSEERTIPEPSEPLPESNKAVCCQDLPTIPSPTSPAFASHVMAESYPFCCNAHSLIFTTHYPASIPIPYPIRQKFRRMAQKSKSLWSAVLSGHNTNTTEWDETPLGRYIQYIGSKEKLQFCNGVARPISPTAMAAANAMGSGSTAASSLNSKQLRDMDDEELVQRRYRIEERIRQDTLAKQELLSLCLMACGLFMVAEGRFRHVPPTLMSLLRRYGPWDKGVWREGEWRRSAIDITVDTELEGASKNKKSVSPSPSLNLSAFVEEIAKEENRSERGPWQNLCIAAIQFLAHENLTWGGATGNEELSRLRIIQHIISKSTDAMDNQRRKLPTSSTRSSPASDTISVNLSSPEVKEPSSRVQVPSKISPETESRSVFVNQQQQQQLEETKQCYTNDAKVQYQSINSASKPQGLRSATQSPQSPQSPSGQFSSQISLGFVPCPQDDGSEDASNESFYTSQGIHELPMQDSSPETTQFSSPDEGHLFGQREHNPHSHTFVETTEVGRLSMQQSAIEDNSSLYKHMRANDKISISDTLAQATTERALLSLAVHNDSNATQSRLDSPDHSEMTMSAANQVKPEVTSLNIVNQEVQGLALISGEDFTLNRQVGREESVGIFMSSQPVEGSIEAPTGKALVNSNQTLPASESVASYTPIQYQYHIQHHESPYNSLLQQPQAHCGQIPLPGINEIAGFYQSDSLSEPSAIDQSQLPLESQQAQYIGLYATSTSGIGAISLPHSYPVAMGFHEIPLTRRRRDRRSVGQQPYGFYYDAMRSQSRSKADDTVNVHGVMTDPTTVPRSESQKQVHHGIVSSSHQETYERDPDPKACNNCQTTSTPSWRRCPKGRILLCNACGLYQKLHGKARPHYLAKDGTIKIQRTIPEHSPCSRCHTRTSPTWKKGPHGEAICHACSTAMRQGRSQNRVKISKTEYSMPDGSMPINKGDMYLDPSNNEFSQILRLSNTHGHNPGINDGIYGNTESLLQQRRHRLSTRYPSKGTQQNYFIEHPSRSGVNQYQGGKQIAYGLGQVGPAFGLSQYGGYDTGGFNLAHLHGHSSGSGGWQSELGTHGSGSFISSAETFLFESSPHTNQSLQQRGNMGLLRMDPPPSILPISQPFTEGQQQLIPYNRLSQTSYFAWEQALHNRMVQTSPLSSTWNNSDGTNCNQTASMSTNFTDQQQHQQHPILISQRIGNSGSHQDQLEQNKLHTAMRSYESPRSDRFPDHQRNTHQEPFINSCSSTNIQPTQERQQEQKHYYREEHELYQQRYHQPHSYSFISTPVQSRNHISNHDQKSQDYEAALRSYVQGEYDDISLPIFPPSSTAADSNENTNTSDAPMQQMILADENSESNAINLDMRKSKETLDHLNSPDGVHHNQDNSILGSEGSLEIIAVETLAHSFTDRQNLPIVSSVSKSRSNSPIMPTSSPIISQVAETKHYKTNVSMVTEGQKSGSSVSPHIKQELREHANPSSFSATSGKNTLPHSPILEEPESSGVHELPCRRSGRQRSGSRNSLISSKSAGKRAEGLMSRHLNQKRH
ncbi:Transcription factor GATA-5 [Linnemannia zychae]|nr:Transcription factor GATA-5 [Linnemannia zychae]